MNNLPHLLEVTFYTFAIWELWIIEFGWRPLSDVGAVTNRTCEISSTCSHNVVNFGTLVVEFGLPVWGAPANFNGFHVFALLLHGRRPVNVNQILHNVWLSRGPSANLECRSEMCCTWLAENTGRKNDAKNRHLGTILQFYRAISSQLRHVSTIGKKLVKQQYLLHTWPQYGELRPTSGW